MTIWNVAVGRCHLSPHADPAIKWTSRRQLSLKPNVLALENDWDAKSRRKRFRR
jgi:hypothetical protein